MAVFRFDGVHECDAARRHRFGNLQLWKCGLTAPKLAKMVVFGINLPGKIIGSIEKLEYRWTTTNLPLCNGTIIVLKSILHHSVHVITNFVIPKRNIKTDKNITLFRLQPARDPRFLP